MPFYTDEQSRMCEAFHHSTTLCVSTCACGRTHFTSANGHGDFEEGELEALQAKAKAEPDKYIEHTDFDHIDSIIIDGQELVPDCACNRIERYWRFIEAHTFQLAKYCAAYLKLKARLAQQEADEAKQAAECVEAAITVIGQEEA